MRFFSWSYHFVNWDNPCKFPKGRKFVAFYKCIDDMCQGGAENFGYHLYKSNRDLIRTGRYVIA